MLNALTRVGFWLLLPISLLQGLRLRKTAIRLPEAGGARSGTYGHGRSLYLLAIGDSIIAGVGTDRVEQSLPVQFAAALATHRHCKVHWRVEGANGADIRELRKKISTLAEIHRPDLILISIGVNDVTGLSSTSNWRHQVNALVVELEQKWPQARVIFAGLPPMGKFPLPPQPLRFTLGLRAATLDRMAADIISQRARMLHIPTDINPVRQEFCEDGFHPSAKACAIWARELAQRI